MNLQDFEQYKRELITEHEAEIAAVERLIARERSKMNGSTGTSIAATGRVRYRRTVGAIVREAVDQMSGRFTRREVGTWITRSYPASPLDSRTVAVELWKLAKEGEIQSVQKGRGRKLAAYRKG